MMEERELSLVSRVTTASSRLYEEDKSATASKSVVKAKFWKNSVRLVVSDPEIKDELLTKYVVYAVKVVSI